MGLRSVCATAILWFCSTAALAAETPWSLRSPQDGLVPFRGVLSASHAGASQGKQVFYPGTDFATFAAAVLVHGAMAHAERDRHQRAWQEASDQVLGRYRPILADFKHRDLMKQAIELTPWGGPKQMIDLTQVPNTGWLVESSPLFSMTQDQRALVLVNAVRITRIGDALPAHDIVVHVVSRPRTDEDVGSSWEQRGGAGLKDESASLLAHSLLLALRDASSPASSEAGPFSMVRYREGEKEKMERAQVVAQPCDRQVARTLRGWLLSVPLDATADGQAAACEPALPGWK